MNGTTFLQNKLLLEKTVAKIFFSMKLETHRQNNIEKKRLLSSGIRLIAAPKIHVLFIPF